MARENQEGVKITMDDVRGGGKGEGEDKAEAAEEEEEFKDAKEIASITSNTSKTQRTAEDSQAGTVMSTIPRPQAGEGGHHVPVAVEHGDG